MPKRSDDSRLCQPVRLAAGASLLAVMLAVAGPAHATGVGGGQSDEPRPTMTYFLPRTDLKVAVSQRLLRCPAAGGAAEVETTVTVTTERAADHAAPVVLDMGSGRLAKRTVKLEFNADRTLTAFNSVTEGQGGPILKSLGKLAFKVAASAAGAPALGLTPPSDDKPPPITCTADVSRIFTQLDKLKNQIEGLETLIAEGKGNPSSSALLSDWRARRSQLQERLTLTTSGTFNVTEAKAASLFDLKSPDYERWFEPTGTSRSESSAPTPETLPGLFGFRITVTPDLANPDRRTIASKGYGDAKEPHKHLVYRHPVLATVEVVPCAPSWNLFIGCPALTTHAGKDASLKGQVALMQLSNDHMLPVGKSRLFGTRQAAAKFDAQGAPVMLEYGSSPGTADAAGVLDTFGEGLDTLRDAETEALQREIAKEKARKELNDLRQAAAEPE